MELLDVAVLLAFFAGIALHVVAAYVKEGIDAALSKVSSFWRNRREAARQRRRPLIDKLKQDKHAQLLILAQEARHRMRSLYYLVGAVPTFVGALLIVFRPAAWFALLLIILSIHEQMCAIRLQSCVDDANE